VWLPLAQQGGDVSTIDQPLNAVSARAIVSIGMATACRQLKIWGFEARKGRLKSSELPAGIINGREQFPPSLRQ